MKILTNLFNLSIVLIFCLALGCIVTLPSDKSSQIDNVIKITVANKIDEYHDNLINPDYHDYFIIDTKGNIYEINGFPASNKFKKYVQYDLNSTYIVHVEKELLSPFPFIDIISIKNLNE